MLTWSFFFLWNQNDNLERIYLFGFNLLLYRQTIFPILLCWFGQNFFYLYKQKKMKPEIVSFSINVTRVFSLCNGVYTWNLRVFRDKFYFSWRDVTGICDFD